LLPLSQSERRRLLEAELRSHFQSKYQQHFHLLLEVALVHQRGLLPIVRSGKEAAIGRLVGEVMKRSGGAADAKSVKEKLLQQLRG